MADASCELRAVRLAQAGNSLAGAGMPHLAAKPAAKHAASCSAHHSRQPLYDAWPLLQQDTISWQPAVLRWLRARWLAALLSEPSGKGKGGQPGDAP